MNKRMKILGLAVCAVLVGLLAVSAFAAGVGSGMGSSTTANDSGMGGVGGMMNDIGDGIDDMLDDSTLGDRDGDGFVEDDGRAGMMGEGRTASDGVLNTTGRDGADGVDPISEGGSSAGSGTSTGSGTGTQNGTSSDSMSDSTSDGGVSWLGVVIAVLLAGALVAVVIALIPKKEH